jgi:hypothetical protein
METIILVTVVLMFAPIIIGIAPAKLRAPPLTIPTIREVVVDELWNIVVERIPMNNAIKGLLVVVSMFSAKSPPICLIAVDSPFIPTKKQYRDIRTPKIFNQVLIEHLLKD